MEKGSTWTAWVTWDILKWGSELRIQSNNIYAFQIIGKGVGIFKKIIYLLHSSFNKLCKDHSLLGDD